MGTRSQPQQDTQGNAQTTLTWISYWHAINHTCIAYQGASNAIGKKRKVREKGFAQLIKSGLLMLLLIQMASGRA
jgi:hypothetical protein